MPGRKKRSKAASQREKTKRCDEKNDKIDEKPTTFQNIQIKSIEKTVSCYVLSGSLHQGDVRFLYPGVQCTFLSFWALVMMENKPPLLWNSADIDWCIIDGNDRFLKHCLQYSNSTETVTCERVTTINKRR